MTSITDGGPIEFLVGGATENYLDLLNTFIHIRAQIVNQDGTLLAADADVAPINYLLNTMWSQVDLSLNGKLITTSTNTYPYRSYLETLLSYGPAAKDTQLSAGLWVGDTAGHMDSRADENTGFQRRKQISERSRICDMMGRLHLDMFFQNRYLINGVDMKLKLTRSKDSFALIAPDNSNFKIKIQDATMIVRQVKLSPAVMYAHIKAISKGLCKYPIRRCELKTYSIAAGNLTFSQENLTLGRLPKRVVVGFVDNDAYNGRYSKNPFHFQNYNINFLSLNVGGEPVQGKPFEPNFERGQTVRGYLSLFTETGQFFRDEGNNITKHDYENGYTLFCFDLSPSLSSGNTHFDLIKQGNLRIEVHFAQALPRTISLLLFLEYENIIEISKTRNVFIDYA
uniref:uncharacterized protein F54H12.2-like n=1 Tax=Styela clava TaxID=7725 RepID=UPI00193998E4|nr:uncharacterized protein F54H12.2-like [Styela clava]